jgi:hypothetical protein
MDLLTSSISTLIGSISTIVIIFIIVQIILYICVFIWLHNCSLNLSRIYYILKDFAKKEGIVLPMYDRYDNKINDESEDEDQEENQEENQDEDEEEGDEEEKVQTIEKTSKSLKGQVIWSTLAIIIGILFLIGGFSNYTTSTSTGTFLLIGSILTFIGFVWLIATIISIWWPHG